jgi:hypothetical protein
MSNLSLYTLAQEYRAKKHANGGHHVFFRVE